MDKKYCVICGKEFEKDKRVSRKIWNIQTKFCSRACMGVSKIGNTFKTGIGYPAWNKGIPQTEEVKQILSKKLKVIAKQKGFGKWMLGKKQNLETRFKKSLAARRTVISGKHNFWKGGITPNHRLIRTTLRYKIWRENVFKRDNYTCQWCGARSGNGKRVYLNADHIQLFSIHTNLRFDVNNGRTLCKSCHYKRHSK